jgi:hypothetical protein
VQQPGPASQTSRQTLAPQDASLRVEHRCMFGSERVKHRIASVELAEVDELRRAADALGQSLD